MRALLIALFFAAASGLLSGCPKTPQPMPDGPPKNLDAAAVPLCSLDAALPVSSDVCKQKVHAGDHRPCAKCPTTHGCLDTVDMVWCVIDCGECIDDSGSQ